MVAECERSNFRRTKEERSARTVKISSSSSNACVPQNIFFSLPKQQFISLSPLTPKSSHLSIRMVSKRVLFEEPETLSVVVCELIPISQLSKHEHENTWYSSDEFTAIRASCMLLSKQLQGSSRARLLEPTPHDAYDKYNGNEVAVMQQMLIRWSRHCTSCRGLERFIQGDRGTKRRQERRRSVLLVLEAQELENDCLPDERAEKLRVIYEQSTAKARLFAMQLGIADAAANTSEQEQSSRWLNLSRTRINGVDVIPSSGDYEIDYTSSPTALTA